ncbi:hypothetical protein [uncultured Massilia sp.]|uniref:hypothetical protein n=1 Tax=uncultured Massilia sp. TaxID=169973 RepID=UPI0025F47238|nr:hypothetical protein [uncultured Massilia sp.]
MNEISTLDYRQLNNFHELSDDEVTIVSGGLPVVAVAAGIVALGGSALDFGYKLGGMLYKITH